MLERFVIDIENVKSHSSKILNAVLECLSRNQNELVYVIGSWQSGDFGHIYAAAVRHFSEKRKPMPLGILIFSLKSEIPISLLNDIQFALGPISEHGKINLFTTTPLDKKDNLIIAMGEIERRGFAVSPYRATFIAESLVKNMKQGQPLTPVWADIARQQGGISYEAYTKICNSFMQDYIDRFGKSSGREKFVCMWARNVPLIGGANPQYNSSEDGNEQLCLNLKHVIPDIKAIFIVGDGFNASTKKIPHVFDLGKFWEIAKGQIDGRFQENGFFDYMTAFYDCDVVHVGMKSGGMDVLGLWGQKVVFIDTVNSHEVTKGRVAAWSTKNLTSVEVDELPTKFGKEIDIARAIGKISIGTTISIPKKVEIENFASSACSDNMFNNDDLSKIARAVQRMFI